MNHLLRSSATHVFRDSLHGHIGIDDDAHHIENVLRLRDGEFISVSDGKGSWVLTRYTHGGELVVESEIYSEPHVRETCVAFVPVKGERTEWTVEKLVEIGVTRIIVLAPTERSVVKWDNDKITAQKKKLERTVIAAASQSRRVWLPSIDVGAHLASLHGTSAAIAEPGGVPIDGSITTVAIGPEGGFAPAEQENWATVGLGPSILRAETAALVAATLMVAHS